jgi:hypothetical protein
VGLRVGAAGRLGPGAGTSQGSPDWRTAAYRSDAPFGLDRRRVDRRFAPAWRHSLGGRRVAGRCPAMLRDLDHLLHLHRVEGEGGGRFRGDGLWRGLCNRLRFAFDDRFPPANLLHPARNHFAWFAATSQVAGPLSRLSALLHGRKIAKPRWRQQQC